MPNAHPATEDAPCVVHLEPDTFLEWLDERTVVGGSPIRRVTLSALGARRLRSWLAGATPQSEDRPFADRLVNTGIVHPRPAPLTATQGMVTFVIPFHGDPSVLLPLLGSLPPDADVIIVDDASPRPPVTDGARIRVLTHDRNRGPAAARNTGWRCATTPFVAFLDADTRPDPAWHRRLLGHLVCDEQLALVAPRLRSAPACGALAHYETTRSPLDMGPDAGLVRRWSRLAYLPSAAWIVRRSALEDVGGFDERMRVGEDVDLVWRLDQQGWRIRFDPSVQVLHEPRGDWAAAARQRHHYGRSSAVLWTRHPTRFRHLEFPARAVVPWLAAATVGPGAAVIGAAATAAAAGITDGLPLNLAARLTLQAQWRCGQHIGDYIRRVGFPVVVLAAATGSRRARRTLAAALVPYLVDWIRDDTPPHLLRYVAARFGDDLAYLSGVWRGAGETGSAGHMSVRLLRPERPRRWRYPATGLRRLRESRRP